MPSNAMIEFIAPRWPAPETVSACFTTRRGGVSRTPYDSLNLAPHVGDDAALVERNRARLRRELGLDAEPEWLRQTHSSRAITLELERDRDADAAITRRRGCVAVVMVADCLPILLCDRAGAEVAALHAGWRGLERGVIPQTLRAMQTPAAELLAWIGPGISQPRFEVGAEVRTALAAAIDGAAAFFEPSARAGHWLCDLAGLAERQLTVCGLTRVYRARRCSFDDAGHFFSYRRDADTGRMAALIWIKD